jgi:hypothetical protein
MIQTVKRFLCRVNIAGICLKEKNILRINPYVLSGQLNADLDVEKLSKGRIKRYTFSTIAESLNYLVSTAIMS